MAVVTIHSDFGVQENKFATIPHFHYLPGTSTGVGCYCLLQTNLDSILKSRDITLPTKVHLVKAMVFLVVMYGSESWAIKEPEH